MIKWPKVWNSHLTDYYSFLILLTTDYLLTPFGGSADLTVEAWSHGRSLTLTTIFDFYKRSFELHWHCADYKIPHGDSDSQGLFAVNV
jgi:hypothetical protein